jgi:hypothetical protein
MLRKLLLLELTITEELSLPLSALALQASPDIRLIALDTATEDSLKRSAELTATTALSLLMSLWLSSLVS